MTRGEGTPRDRRGVGLAIGVVFTVICLFAAFVVVTTSDSCDGLYGSPPIPAVPVEPFAGAASALSLLGHRDCGGQAAGPRVAHGAARPRAVADRVAAQLGYVPAGEWSDERNLPLTALAAGLEGRCGVVAIGTDAWASMQRARSADGAWYRSCDDGYRLIAACGDQPVSLEGSGTAYSRAWAMPAITADDLDAIGVSAEAVLGHAEAEVQLRRVGWIPSDQCVVEEVASGAPAWVAPPASPASGCVPWVAVAIGLGDATSEWMGATLDHDPATERFVLGTASCERGLTGRIDFHDVGSDGGLVVWRPYEARSGPSTGSGDPSVPTSVRALRAVAAEALSLPTAVPVSP